MKQKKGKSFFPLSLFSDSFDSLKRGSYAIIIPVLFDFLFILSLGIILGFFGDRIINNLYSIGAAMLQDQTVSAFVRKIIFSVAGIFAALYLFYSIFQSVSWKYAISFAGKTPERYIRKFFGVNLFFFACFIIYSSLSFMIDFFMTNNAEMIIFHIILYLFLFAVMYFAVISYIISSEDKRIIQILKETLSFGAKKLIYIIPHFIFVLLILLIADLILSKLASAASAGTGLMIILGVIILLPLATLARIYLILAVQHIKKFI